MRYDYHIDVNWLRLIDIFIPNLMGYGLHKITCNCVHSILYLNDSCGVVYQYAWISQVLVMGRRIFVWSSGESSTQMLKLILISLFYLLKEYMCLIRSYVPKQDLSIDRVSEVRQRRAFRLIKKSNSRRAVLCI